MFFVLGLSKSPTVDLKVSGVDTLTQNWVPYQKEATGPNFPWRAWRKAAKLPAEEMSGMLPSLERKETYEHQNCVSFPFRN